jgi:hypothetical protein
MPHFDATPPSISLSPPDAVIFIAATTLFHATPILPPRHYAAFSAISFSLPLLRRHGRRAIYAVLIR